MKFADLPIWGAFEVREIHHNTVLHSFDGEGHGDYPFELGEMDVCGMYAKDGKIIVEVYPNEE